jgi:hypothetical protein
MMPKGRGEEMSIKVVVVEWMEFGSSRKIRGKARR